MELLQIKDIGPKTAALLEKLNVRSAEDLIAWYPKRVAFRGELKKPSEFIVGEPAAFAVKITKTPEIIKGVVKLRSNGVELIWFNRPYLKNYLKPGKEFIFFGEASERFGRLQIVNPEIETDGRDPFVAIYKTAGLSQKVMRKLIKNALAVVKIKENLPGELLLKYDLPARESAVADIHFPPDDGAFFRARRRFAFEEAFIYFQNFNFEETKNFFVKDFDYSDLKFPFELTAAQKKVADEIIEDMRRGAMNRLVEGDVGCGKTAVAAIAAHIVIKNGRQCCLMAPTEVLARQHFEFFKNYFNAVFISGSQKSDISNAQMVIGTHAVFQEKIKFRNLGLVIADEQHRFGVAQRKALIDKGANPYVLITTATPIPRTLALTMFRGMDISIINQLPQGRQKIETYLVNSKYEERIINFVKKTVEAGQQCYIVTPSIQSEESVAAKFKNFRAAVLNGKLKNKYEVLEDFLNKKFDVLISTTVVEVGVNVPNATLMIALEAERFGLSQLHQLRGRVGRGSEKSHCVLVSDSVLAKPRLKILTESSDGFYIAEKDLETRGCGDFFGTRQSGAPFFKLADPARDAEIFKAAALESKKYLLKKTGAVVL